MASGMRMATQRPVQGNWWRDFFEPLVGEVLFTSSKRAHAEHVR